MATSRIRTGLTLVTGAACGFLAALLLQDAPAPAPGGDHGPVAPRRAAADPGAAAAAGTPAPPATLAGILRIEGDFAQTAALYALIGDAGIADLERLIDEAESVPGSSDRRAALAILFARYADLDPAAALELARSRGGSRTELHAVFHAWARADMTAAVEAAVRLPPEMRMAAGVAILMSRDDLDAAAQGDVARRLDLEAMLPELALQQGLDQAGRDPRAAWAAAMSDGERDHRRLAAIARSWARQDPQAAMEAAMSLGNGALRVPLQHQILHHWSRVSPQQALDWALAQPPSPQRPQLTAMALSAMAQSDPRLALDIAQSLEGQERAQGMNQVLSTWAQDDPASAARAVDWVSAGNARLNAIVSIASSYASRDPQGAVQWVAGLDPGERSPAVSVMFSVLTRIDPLQAGSFVTSMVEEGSRAEAAEAVASSWAEQDPVAAARWVDALGDDGLRTRATASLVRQWAAYDREAALRYAEQIPAAAERDAALVSIIQAQHGDAAYAERLFDRLTDPQQRLMAARQLYLFLRDADPPRAERYRELAGFRNDAGGRR